MSGILVVLDMDGGPADTETAARLLRCPSLRLRGPDASNLISDGPISMAHTLLRTTHESACEQQPLSFDGRVWIVADGRVDARGDFVEALSDDRVSRQSPDVELLLSAYLKWGERCVDHLLGDFAFAVWDSRESKLFCARDQMGIKPLYYAKVGHSLVVSSTIESLRRHSEVSSRLNDAAVTDFLTVGFNENPRTTTFSDIQRLPPAHSLVAANSTLDIRRYWSLPIDDVRYRRSDAEYIDEFDHLTSLAVSDRLRCDGVSIFLSGGLDSSTLATKSLELLRAHDGGSPVHGFCVYYSSLFRDPEPVFARTVADHLGIPFRSYAYDERPGWFAQRAAEVPEPSLELLDHRPGQRMYADMARHSRVALYGEGPDNALKYEWKAHVDYLLRRHEPFRLMADIGKHIVAHRRVPLLPSLPKMMRERARRRGGTVLERLIVRQRPAPTQNHDAPAQPLHPAKPLAYASLLTSQWHRLFESSEPAYTGVSLEVRLPFLDLRMLRFLLSIPALPWSRTKYVMRRALKGRVPEVIRTRPKVPLAGDPWLEQLARSGPPALSASPVVSHFVDISSLDEQVWRSPEHAHVGMRAAALSYWLTKTTQ